MQLTNYLLYPTLEKSQFEEIPTTARNYSFESLKLYRRRADADYLRVDANNPLDFAILVTSAVVKSTRCSKVYFGHLCLDFNLGVESVIFKRTFRLNYVSSTEKASEKDLLRHLDPEGGPEKWEFVSEDMELDFAGYKGTKNINSISPTHEVEADACSIRFFTRHSDGVPYGLAACIQRGGN